MDDAELLRYSRHILLDEVGIEGQQRILQGHALIVGVGGLGSPAAMYLAAAGVGTLSLVDPDTVELSNLQRQIAHGSDSVGQTKVASAGRILHAINPLVHLHTHALRASPEWLDAAVAAADVVLDCSDNFPTRQAVNAACVQHGKPLVSGAAVRFDGQISVYDPRNASAPCYACVHPPHTEAPPVPCATLGVFAPLVGIIGSMQAAEALKLLAGVGESLAGRLLLLDGRRMAWNEVRLPRLAACPVCSAVPNKPQT